MPSSKPQYRFSAEQAEARGDVPFVSSRKQTMTNMRRRVVLARLAKEYVIDFNLVQACARADLDWEDARHAEREPFFLALVRELMDSMSPADVVTRQEILLNLKREAQTAGKSSDRIRAWTELAELTGMKLPAEEKQSTIPDIHIHLSPQPSNDDTSSGSCL